MGDSSKNDIVHSPLVTYASMICLLTLCPPFVILLWYTMTAADGSILQTFDYLKNNGLQGFLHLWPKPTLLACKIIAVYGVFEAALQLHLPGETVYGPISPTGNRPIYKANGIAAYLVTLVTYIALWWFGIFNPTIVYDHLGEIYSTLIFGSFIFCIFLYIKGHVAPSSADSGSSGNIIIDFYWGMELYPRIGKYFDIKVFTNCRFGMMSWAVLALTYCIKQYEENGKVADSMLVNTALMLIYVTKFFWWEAGYWNTMDIAHDRAGFYICWGCLVWVPSIYTSPGMYLVNHPVNLGTQLALFILVAGILCIYINYDCDRQRQEFRRTNGKCLVWGKAPSKIEASYTTTSGETKKSLLLTSGWWGLSRHFHYVPEILAAFFWTVPALFNHFLPYFYVIFLTILLFDRAKRDDDRCRSKYGKYWKLYCDRANGIAAYLVTLVTYIALWWFGIFNPTIVYDHLGEIYSTLIFGSFIFCIFLYIKGHVAPSSADSGSSGNIIIDFYWGMELYPRIGKYFDIKVFTNCRFGMMSWAVLALTYCIKQYEENGKVADSMLVNTALMLIYVTKFFWWEAGYWNTMDIAHDRAGFYICWGCLVWVPSIYTSPGMYLVNHPVNLGTQLALFILVAGILCIYINYDCDRQRQEFRRTNGKCLVWGKAPSKIEASYTTTSGETKKSLLLTSGWWGLSRHFHYVPEILAAFFWTVPALFNHFLPYFYVIFLTILLFDRAKRDDDRCRSKYGKYWKLYCDRVPYRIIPGIY